MAGLFSEMTVPEPDKLSFIAINDALNKAGAHRIVLSFTLTSPEFDAFAKSLYETEETFIALIKRYGYKDEEDIEDA